MLSGINSFWTSLWAPTVDIKFVINNIIIHFVVADLKCSMKIAIIGPTGCTRRHRKISRISNATDRIDACDAAQIGQKAGRSSSSRGVELTLAPSQLLSFQQ